ncbi:MAG: cytochrome b/b6 domain-containing protein [Bryobacterales bacterium]|nr:cytochrome b/b6 domain-containing protein [Bryobacterales bacterium]
MRLTHWIATICFFTLLLSGIQLVISHPRFYWGETGNVNTAALFQLPIPSSRATVKTGYGFVLPDQNGWSRSLHFQSAWLVGFTGLLYVIHGLATGHFRNNTYRRPQRLTYLAVVFVLFPLMIWTGLAMSPAVTAAVPLDVFWGGRQSARTVHFLVTLWLVLFLAVHVLKVYGAGFRKLTGAMITGRIPEEGR